MTTKLHPDLLRACAAYLAHADVYEYVTDFDQRLDPLRAVARKVDVSLSYAKCNSLARRYIRLIQDEAEPSSCLEWPERSKLARAILDATPGMLEWWCERLAR